MIDLNSISHLYFIGIGGIGMSALAMYFHKTGKQVAGYDRTPSPITENLQDVGIAVNFEDSIDSIPQAFLVKKQTLVVYTPAIPKSHEQLTYYQTHNFNIKKRAAVLGHIANAQFSIAVAGTHGKTTTSSILGHVLAETGVGVTAFIGGITNNYNSNLICKGNDVILVEADEFDRSFLSLQPDIACITSVDADHLDIYENADEVALTFKAFAKSVKSSKNIFVKNGLPISGNTVGINDDSDYCAKNIRIEEGTYIFDFKHPYGVIKDMHFNLPGWHNLFNAITALGMAMTYGSPTESLPKALLSFSGVNRRFTYRLKNKNRVLIDDYAHHPTEIKAIHQSVREMYPREKVLAVFQPHLFSRTRDFMEDFATALSDFDSIYLLDIYPARELPIVGVTSEVLLEKITQAEKQIVTKELLPQLLQQSTYKIIVMMGAGDISETILKVTEVLADAS